MKRICLLMVLILPLTLEAQNNKWRVYPSLGVDMGGATPFPFSDIPDGAKGTPKINPNLGFGFSHQLYNRWSLSLEVSYHLLAFSARADVRSQPFYFDNNTVTPEGGLRKQEADDMNLAPNLLESFKLPEITVATGANTSGDPLTSAHMRNWMDCVRSRKQPHAPVEAGFNHAVACIMANAAYRTGTRTTFDEKTQEVMAGGKVFVY